MRGNAIVHVDINSGSWERNYMELQARLGEIPATHKADQSLRAVISGQDPDSKELRSL